MRFQWSTGHRHTISDHAMTDKELKLKIKMIKNKLYYEREIRLLKLENSRLAILCQLDRLRASTIKTVALENKIKMIEMIMILKENDVHAACVDFDTTPDVVSSMAYIKAIEKAIKELTEATELTEDKNEAKEAKEATEDKKEATEATEATEAMGPRRSKRIRR